MAGNFISVRTNFPDVMRQLDRLETNIGDKVMVRSLNKTIDQGKIEMARDISSEFRIGVAAVKERLTVRKLTFKRGMVKFEVVLEATNKGKGRSMNLIAFVEKSISFAQARKRMKAGEGGTQTLRGGGVITKALQLRFQIKRAGGPKMIKGLFIGNKGRTVFQRVGKDRFPIEAKNTIDVPQMFNTKRINAAVVKAMLQKFEQNFDRELRVVLGGFLK